MGREDMEHELEFFFLHYFHLKNDFQVTQDRGFPFISYNPRLKLPVESRLKGKRVTVKVSLLTPAPDQCSSVDQLARKDDACQDISAQSMHSVPLTSAPIQEFARDRPEQLNVASQALSAMSENFEPVTTESETLTMDCVRDGLTYISLPSEARELVFKDSQIPSMPGDTVFSGTPMSSLEIQSVAISKDKLCNTCHVYTEKCSCRRQCNICTKSTTLDEKCDCDSNNILALKARIEKDIFDESDVVTTEEQTDVSKIVDDKFEMFNIAPPAVTDKVDLTHITSPEEKKLITSLLSEHKQAFSSHRYDVGHFEFFEAELDCKPGSSVIERERPMKPAVREELRPIINELLEAGIIRKATTQGPFLSNSHGVSKPINSQHLAGKADLHILKMNGGDTNHSRLTLDLRPLNDNAINRPRINLPSYEDLVPVFKNKHITTADLCSMYWSIHVTENTQHLSNFWYDHQVFSFCSLPQGWLNSCFVGQSATAAAYGQAAMLEFLKFKGWKQGSELWPWTHINQCLIVFMDDYVLLVTIQCQTMWSCMVD